MLQPDADPVAGVAWLADLYDGTADPEAIADADLTIGETLHCEVLAEVTEHEIRPPKIARPVAVGFELVYQERTLLAAMSAEVRLTVAIEIQSTGENPAGYRLLPDGRPDGPALPRDVLRKSDINRNDHAHLGTCRSEKPWSATSRFALVQGTAFCPLKKIIRPAP